jgi:molybdate/tungstate transport system ATP-binding protein
MVTHDFAEALSLGSRGAVLNNGRIEQIGTMQDIFQRPDTVFVADFVGMKNIFEAQFNGSRAIIGNGLEIDMGGEPLQNKGRIAIRPDDIAITTERAAPKNGNVFTGSVTGLIDQGFYYEAHIQVEKVVFKSLVSKKSLFELDLFDGSRVVLSFEAATVHTIMT